MQDWEIRRERLAEYPKVEIVTIDRPPVNAISEAMYDEIASIFQSVTDNAETRCFILTGAGSRAFIAGADVREFLDLRPDNGPSYMKIRRRSFESLRDCPVPVVGAINGPALGAGLAFAAACDILVASDNATFGIPEINVGVLGGAKHLSRLVPAQMVRQMALTGRRLTAPQMQGFGGVSAVVPLEELRSTAITLAAEIAAKSPYAARLAKEALNLIETMGLEQGYQVEQLHSIILSALGDSKKAAEAFLNGTEPEF